MGNVWWEFLLSVNTFPRGDETLFSNSSCSVQLYLILSWCHMEQTVHFENEIWRMDFIHNLPNKSGIEALIETEKGTEHVWIEDSPRRTLLSGRGLWYKTVRWWHRVQSLYPLLKTPIVLSFFTSPCRRTGQTERVEGQEKQHPKTQIRLVLTPYLSPARPRLWSQVDFTSGKTATSRQHNLQVNDSERSCSFVFDAPKLSEVPHYFTTLQKTRVRRARDTLHVHIHTL